MRQVKFRAWDKTKNEMLPDILSMIDVYGFFNEEFYIPMQFTGLKDRKGVDIYEGDVVICDKRRCTVVWDQSECGFKYEPEFQDEVEQGGHMYYVVPYNNNEVIIGNIYEPTHTPQLTTR